MNEVGQFLADNWYFILVIVGFPIARVIVKRTKTTVDDEILEEIESGVRSRGRNEKKRK